MLKKKQVLALVGIVCVAAICLSAIAVEAAWDGTLDGFLEDWDWARHKVWQAGRYSWDTWFLTGNTHGWGDISEALDDMKTEIEDIPRVESASGTYTNEGWMPGWDIVETVDAGSGETGRFTLSYTGKTADLAGIDAEAWIWLQITSDGTYWRTVETIHLTKPPVAKKTAIPYRTYEFAARGFKISVLLHTQTGKELTLNYAYFYEVLL